MARILIQPAGGAGAREHFEVSIAKKVKFDDHIDVLTSSEYDSLKSDFADGEAAMWGLVPGEKGVNAARWESVTAGDIVLFSGKKKMFAMGRVATKFHNPSFAAKLWGHDSKGQTWEYMYTLVDVKDIDLPYSEFNSTIGDNPNNNHLGFRIVNEEKSARFISYLRGEGATFRDIGLLIGELTADEIYSVLDEWSSRWSPEFLSQSKLNPAFKYVIIHNGVPYDAKAVLELALRRKIREDLGAFEGNERTVARPLRKLGFVVTDKNESTKRFWWVNQNRTREEAEQGFMWSPKTRRDGGYNQFYENMARTKPGDIVFSYFDSRIQGHGIVTDYPTTTEKPSFRQRESWADVGWFVEVEFEKFEHPVSPRAHAAELAPLLPERYAPIQSSGEGLQGVYLAEISEVLANKIFELSGRKPDESLSNSTARRIRAKQVALSRRIERQKSELQQEQEIQDSKHLGETEKESLTKSRRGQGKFRRNVINRGPRCRVTGVGEPHLIASHIKPWKDSTNDERIDGNNGLMLAPHIDHLFNDGYLSFKDDGTVLISDALDESVIERWNLATGMNVGVFADAQCAYLKYHRENVFMG